MCELLAISSRHSTQLSLSLEAMAARSTAIASVRDGWGVAFYQGLDVALFREPAPASNSPLEQLLESRGPHTTLALSHLRHATQGAITLANTQPFVRELAGRTHVFAHNGNLPGIETSLHLTTARFHPVGQTDSEVAFCALLQRLLPLWQSADVPSVQARLAVVTAFAAELRELGPANFLYADGEVLFAHGHRRIHAAHARIEPPGLFMLTRECPNEQTPLQTEGVRVDAGYQAVVLLASVPLSDEAWQPLAEGETVAVSAGRLLARHIPAT